MSNFRLKNIKKFRVLRHFSQEQMAKTLKISRPTYVDIENGEKEITLDQLEILLKLLRVDIKQILDIPSNSRIFTNLKPASPKEDNMSTFYCLDCGYRMCNSSDDNTFEYFLIKTNIYNLKEKQYEKIVAQENKDTEQWNEEFPDDVREPDTWFGVCLELGQDAWICPQCKTMYIFKQGSNELESVYRPDTNWRKNVNK